MFFSDTPNQYIGYDRNWLVQLVILFKDSIMHGAANYYTEAERTAWVETTLSEEEWHQRLSRQHTVLAINDEQLVGFASRKDDYIDLLYVHPDCLRRGIANTLYTLLEEQAIAAGHRILYTNASKAARPFFEKQGYKVVSEQNVCRGSAVLVNYRMEKTY